MYLVLREAGCKISVCVILVQLFLCSISRPTFTLRA